MASQALVLKAQELIAPRAQDVAALAREHTAAAVATLVEMLNADDEKLRVAAAAALLDRGWGRPGQPIEAARPFAQLSDAQLTRAIDDLRQVLATAKPTKRSRKS